MVTITLRSADFGSRRGPLWGFGNRAIGGRRARRSLQRTIDLYICGPIGVEYRAVGAYGDPTSRRNSLFSQVSFTQIPGGVSRSTRSRPAAWCNSVRVRLCGSDHAVISSGVATPSCGGGVVSRAMVAHQPPQRADLGAVNSPRSAARPVAVVDVLHYQALDPGCGVLGHPGVCDRRALGVEGMSASGAAAWRRSLRCSRLAQYG
jgi:hypothetical protein